jgi:hypothetical protein
MQYFKTKKQMWTELSKAKREIRDLTNHLDILEVKNDLLKDLQLSYEAEALYLKSERDALIKAAFENKDNVE